MVNILVQYYQKLMNNSDEKLNENKRFNFINEYESQIQAYDSQLKLIKSIKHIYVRKLARNEKPINHSYTQNLFKGLKYYDYKDYNICVKKKIMEEIIFRMYYKNNNHENKNNNHENKNTSIFYQPPEIEFYNKPFERINNYNGYKTTTYYKKGDISFERISTKDHRVEDEKKESQGFRMYSCDHNTPKIIGSEDHIKEVIEDEDDLIYDYDQNSNGNIKQREQKNKEREIKQKKDEEYKIKIQKRIEEEKKYLNSIIEKQNKKKANYIPYDEITEVLKRINKMSNSDEEKNMKELYNKFLDKYIYRERPKSCKEPKCGYLCYTTVNNVDHHTYKTQYGHENHEGYCYTYYSYECLDENDWICKNSK